MKLNKVKAMCENATSGFESRLNPRSCEVRPLTTAGSAKMSRPSFSLAQAFWLKRIEREILLMVIPL